MSRRAAIITFVVLALLAALGYWISRHVEKRAIEIPIGLHGEAKRNPLLAAQRYLTHRGMAVERLEDGRRMQTAPGENDALIITSDRQTLGQARTEELLAWVKRGGRLIVTVPPLLPRFKGEMRDPSPPRDPLLTALGLGLARSSSAAHDKVGPEQKDGQGKTVDDTEANDDEDVGTCPARETYTEVSLPSAGEVLRADFNQYEVLTGAKYSDTVARHEGGVALVSRDLGQGHISVLTDMGIFQYRAIGELDHALLLWYLVKGADKVWLVTDNDMPPIALWLWQHAPQSVTAVFLFLLFWIWSRSARFGPLVPEPAPTRRRILEHIEAAGRFLWLHQKQERLLKSVREALTATAARRHPGWAGMSEQEKIGHLASLSGWNSEALHQLLYTAAFHRRQDFFHVIRQLETIRKKL